MRTIALAFRYLWSRPLSALLNLLLLTLGLASITFVLLVSHEVDRAFRRDLSGIDAVVGAKGSPLQLIMAGVFQIDVPPGSVPLADVQKLQTLPVVNQVIPLSIADSYRGFRIVGTTAAYLDHYRVRVAKGELWRRSMHAVVGAEVARATRLDVGSSFQAMHGLEENGVDHIEAPYRVMGVLAPCNCVLDRLILTTVESVNKLHEKPPAPKPTLSLVPSFSMAPAPEGSTPSGSDPATVIEQRAAPEAQPEPEPQPEVSMALVTYRNAAAAQTFPRYVNANTHMQVASPALEVTRLLRLLGLGTEVLQGLGGVLLVAAALSVFIALWNAVRERRADLAMLRMLGATPLKVAVLLVFEAFWLALLASLLGLLAGHVITAIVGHVLQAQQSLPLNGWMWLPGELWIPVAAIGVAGIAALIPAITAYRVDVAQLLTSR